MLGEATALELTLGSRRFRSQAFPWSNGATLFVAWPGNAAPLELCLRFVLLDIDIEVYMYYMGFLIDINRLMYKHK